LTIKADIGRVQLVALVLLLDDLVDLGLVLHFADRVNDFVELSGHVGARFLRKNQHFASEVLVSVKLLGKNPVSMDLLVQLLLGPQQLLKSGTRYHLFVAENL
jgi:hypothetical protein